MIEESAANSSSRATKRSEPKAVRLVPVVPPPAAERTRRNAAFAIGDEKRTRYHLPASLESGSPVGYRTRVALSRAEGEWALGLASLERVTGFGPKHTIREEELFEECALGVLSARQSTNYRGHRTVVVGSEDSSRVAALLRVVDRTEAPVLDDASYTHLVVATPYRTPFTKLLTFIGHKAVASTLTVPLRALGKVALGRVDIPTIGYLTELHIGVLAEAMERATVVASRGQRRAQVFLEPMDARANARDPKVRAALAELEAMAGLTKQERRRGGRIAMVVQVGTALASETFPEPPIANDDVWRRLGANLLAFRSERVQPGVNAEESAPPEYQTRQTMDVPDELTTMAGRAAYNAFCHFLACPRELAKSLILLERVDVLTPNGKERLRAVRTHLEDVTDRIMGGIPTWANMASGGALRRNVARGKKAFALAGQRIYIGGLSRPEVERAGIDFTHAVRAFGAAAARSALVAEIVGTVELPNDCDLLAGVCLMAGPVNQNDIAKTFYGGRDLLADAFAGRDPTSLLVWTLKAKTVADPIGNEEQLMNPKRKGVLVDLRAAPHEVIAVRRDGRNVPMRSANGVTSEERAFADVTNFVVDENAIDIPGNRGVAWPEAFRVAPVWPM